MRLINSIAVIILFQLILLFSGCAQKGSSVDINKQSIPKSSISTPVPSIKDTPKLTLTNTH